MFNGLGGYEKHEVRILRHNNEQLIIILQAQIILRSTFHVVTNHITLKCRTILQLGLDYRKTTFFLPRI